MFSTLCFAIVLLSRVGAEALHLASTSGLTPPIKNENVSKKPLVVMYGQARGGAKTWNSARRHLIAPLDAHLALLGDESLMDMASHFDNVAFSWFVPDAPFLEDMFEEQVKPAATWRNVYCKLSRFQILGGIAPGCHPGSAGILLFYRHYFLKKIQSLRLHEKYSHFIFTRSDYFYRCDHPSVEDLKPNEIMVPRGEEYGGVTDRHTVFKSEAYDSVLGITGHIFAQPSRLKIKENLESTLLHYYKQKRLSIKKFSPTAFTVATSQDPTRWRKSSEAPDALLRNTTLRPKYHGEFHSSAQTCKNKINVKKIINA